MGLIPTAFTYRSVKKIKRDNRYNVLSIPPGIEQILGDGIYYIFIPFNKYKCNHFFIAIYFQILDMYVLLLKAIVFCQRIMRLEERTNKQIHFFKDRIFYSLRKHRRKCH